MVSRRDAAARRAGSASCGWVRNREDGSVEAEVEGERDGGRRADRLGASRTERRRACATSRSTWRDTGGRRAGPTLWSAAESATAPRAGRGILLALVWPCSRSTASATSPSSATTRPARSGIVQDVVAGHWLWPRFNDELLPDKPTLYHWLAARRRAPLGGLLRDGRPPAVGAGGGAALVWWTVDVRRRAARTRRPASPPASLLATTRSLFAHARVARPDMLLVLLPVAGARPRLPLVARRAAGATPPPRWRCSVRRRWPRGRWRRRCSRVTLGLASSPGSATSVGYSGSARRPGSAAFVGPRSRLVRAGLGRLGPALRRAAPDRPLRAQPRRRPREPAHAYSPKPSYFHLLFYPQHLPAVALAVDAVRRARALAAVAPTGGLRDPRAPLPALLGRGAGARLHAGGVEAALLPAAVPSRRWRCSPGRRSCA